MTQIRPIHVFLSIEYDFMTDDKKDMPEIEQVALDDIIRLTGYYKKKLIKVKKEMIKLKHHSRINENSNNREFKVDGKIAERDDSGHQSFDVTLATSNENTQNETKRYTPAKDCSSNTNVSDKILDNIQLKHMCSDKLTDHIQKNSHTHNNYANRYVNKAHYANNIHHTNNTYMIKKRNTLSTETNIRENKSLVYSENMHNFIYFLDKNRTEIEYTSTNHHTMNGEDGEVVEFELNNKHCTRQIKFSGSDIKEFFNNHKMVVSELSRICNKRIFISKIRVVKDDSTKKLVVHTKTDDDYKLILNQDWSMFNNAFISGVRCEPIIQDYPVTMLIPLAYDINDIFEKYFREIGAERIERKKDSRTNSNTDRVILYMSTPRSFSNLLKNRNFSFKGDSSLNHTTEISVWLRFAPQCSHCMRINHTRKQCTITEKVDQQCGKCLESMHSGRCNSKRICRLCGSDQHISMDRLKCPIWIRDTIAKNKHLIEVLKISQVINDDYGIYFTNHINETTMKVNESHCSPLSRNKTKSIILDDATTTSKPPLYDLNISDIIEKKITTKLKSIDDKIVEHGVMIDKLSKEQVEQEIRMNTIEKKLMISKDNNRILKLWEADYLNKVASNNKNNNIENSR